MKSTIIVLVLIFVLGFISYKIFNTKPVVTKVNNEIKPSAVQ